MSICLPVVLRSSTAFLSYWVFIENVRLKGIPSSFVVELFQFPNVFQRKLQKILLMKSAYD